MLKVGDTVVCNDVLCSNSIGVVQDIITVADDKRFYDVLLDGFIWYFRETEVRLATELEKVLYE